MWFADLTPSPRCGGPRGAGRWRVARLDSHAARGRRTVAGAAPAPDVAVGVDRILESMRDAS